MLSEEDLSTQRDIHWSAKFLWSAGTDPRVWRQMMILSKVGGQEVEVVSGVGGLVVEGEGGEEV